MKVFSGFPSGKLSVTPLPNLFFTELLPAIDDLAELKVTLYLFWRLAHDKHRARCVSAAELRSDVTLTRGLAETGTGVEEALERGLQASVARGTFLHLTQDGQELYFLNTESGRRAFEKMERGEDKFVPSTAGGEPAETGPRPNIFTLYEQNIGLLTPMLSEQLKEAEQQYPGEWIADAFKIAVENNKRSWSYIRKILERWQTEGRTSDTKKRKHWWLDEYDKYINR